MDGADVDVCLGFVVIELPMRFVLFGERAPKTPLF